MKLKAINHTLPELSDDTLDSITSKWFSTMALSEKDAIKKASMLPHTVKDFYNKDEYLLKNYDIIPVAITTGNTDVEGGKEIVILDEDFNFEYTGNTVF